MTMSNDEQKSQVSEDAKAKFREALERKKSAQHRTENATAAGGAVRGSEKTGPTPRRVPSSRPAMARSNLRVSLRLTALNGAMRRSSGPSRPKSRLKRYPSRQRAPILTPHRPRRASIDRPRD